MILLSLSACGDDVVDSSDASSSTGDGDGDPTGDGDGDGDPTGDGDGDPTGDGDGDPTGDGDGDMSGDGDGDPTGDGDGDGDACVPLSDDPGNIGVECNNDAECGPGYTCHPFNGFVLQFTCQILCSEDCECPNNFSCNLMADKIDQWMECQPN